MRSGQKCFCSKSNFCGKTCFFKIFEKKTEKRDFKQFRIFLKRYMMIELLKKYPITENLKRNSWRDLLDKWFFLPKNGKLDLVRKNTIEKNHQKRDETKKNRTNKVLQREMTNSKLSDFQ